MEFFLEINVEEMPSSHVKSALTQLKEKIESELGSFQISINWIKTHGTCRRLVVLGDFAPRQEDREEIFVGPPKAVAVSPDGNFTAAALGFAKSQGVDPNELEIVRTSKGEYLGLKRIEKGKTTQEILAKALPSLITSLSFPKMMRWTEGSLRFSRPIKNILCLFDTKIVPFSVDGISSRDTTTGHKLHAPAKRKVRSFAEYAEILRKARVIVDEEERKEIIVRQTTEHLAPLKARIHPDEDLLEKLTYDVEHPLVFLGSFPEEYLNLPLEVLSTAMKEGQKLFSVVKDKKQLPVFLGVADAYQDAKSLIRNGNERVLKARLEDARFFWGQDVKIPLRERVPGLEKVIFQEKLGSYKDKAERMKKIVAYLCDKIDERKMKKELVLAAELCKTDLVTEMVREFPSLQGKVGGLYARKQGYSSLVSQAVYEHYQPISLEDNSPSSLGGSLLSIADKMDSIVGGVGVGIEVSGSSDPFGLRRNAHGVCKIILDRKIILSLSRLLGKVLTVYGDILALPKAEVMDYCQKFFENRLRYIFERMGYRYDLVNAALGPGIDNVYHTFLRLKALDALKASPQFEPMILIAKRVNNILRDQTSFRVNSDLFREKQERELASIFSIIKENVAPIISRGDFSQAQKIIFRIQSSLNSFFDHVLVMTEDKKLRQNRLGLLQSISRLLVQVADYSQVVIEKK